ncbi:unnamed protein product [Linum trigynum]|uniref:Uncharacterized protein n=1 Tax=Linum trigynum TaxID=586398 RepID=A0AAV2CT44_9ROSI
MQQQKHLGFPNEGPATARVRRKEAAGRRISLCEDENPKMQRERPRISSPSLLLLLVLGEKEREKDACTRWSRVREGGKQSTRLRRRVITWAGLKRLGLAEVEQIKYEKHCPVVLFVRGGDLHNSGAWV